MKFKTWLEAKDFGTFTPIDFEELGVWMDSLEDEYDPEQLNNLLMELRSTGYGFLRYCFNLAKRREKYEDDSSIKDSRSMYDLGHGLDVIVNDLARFSNRISKDLDIFAIKAEIIRYVGIMLKHKLLEKPSAEILHLGWQSETLRTYLLLVNSIVERVTALIDKK